MNASNRQRFQSSTAEASDAQLLADIARQNVSALGALFDRHHRRIARVLARIGVGAADADDIIQQTFLEVMRIAKGYDGRDSCAAWLCGIAIRLAARRHRSLGRLLRTLTSFARAIPPADSIHPERVAANRQELALFATALSKLGRKKREAFVLMEIEGFSAEEAGKATRTPPATMRTRLFHARNELRQAMERHVR